jgi:outer membrane cobalamin receptor
LQGLKILGQQNPYTGVTVENPENAYTGDVSAAYFIRPSQTKLRAHAGNSYRAPSPFERFGASFFFGSYSYFGDPRLSPEHATAFDLGLDQWLMHSKIRLGATFFYTNLRDTIIFDFANFPPNDPFQRFGGYRNSKGGGIARGVEWSTEITPTSRTSVRFNYTFTNADSRTPTIGANFFEVAGASKHMFTAVVTQRITRRLRVTFDYFVASEYSYSPFGANSRRLLFSGPNKADFVVNYTIPLGDTRSIDLYGKLENAFDVRYFELGSTTPGIWGIGGIKFSF